jgi:hypothetical protein
MQRDDAIGFCSQQMLLFVAWQDPKPKGLFMDKLLVLVANPIIPDQSCTSPYVSSAALQRFLKFPRHELRLQPFQDSTDARAAVPWFLPHKAIRE